LKDGEVGVMAAAISLLIDPQRPQEDELPEPQSRSGDACHVRDESAVTLRPHY